MAQLPGLAQPACVVLNRSRPDHSVTKTWAVSDRNPPTIGSARGAPSQEGTPVSRAHPQFRTFSEASAVKAERHKGYLEPRWRVESSGWGPLLPSASAPFSLLSKGGLALLCHLLVPHHFSQKVPWSSVCVTIQGPCP